MDLGLKDKVAFVMAGSKGLGKAVALELAKEGAYVSIMSRSSENLKKPKKKLSLSQEKKSWQLKEM